MAPAPVSADRKSCPHRLFSENANDKTACTADQASPVAQMVRNLPAVWEAWARPLGQEDPLGKGMAAHSCVLNWRMPWIEEPAGLHFMESQRRGCD